MSYNVVISTINYQKIKAVTSILHGLGLPFTLITKDVDNGVYTTPLMLDDIIQGVTNQIVSLKGLYRKKGIDLWISNNSGVIKINTRYYAITAVIVENKKGQRFESLSAPVPLPRSMTKNLHINKRLEDILDPKEYNEELFDRLPEIGVAGLLTNGVYTKIDEYHDAVAIALAQCLAVDNVYQENYKKDSSLE